MEPKLEPRITLLSEKKLVGKHRKMSFSNDQTPQLWKSFMPYRQAIKNQISTDLISLQVYPLAFNFLSPDYNREFTKWAAVEVSKDASIPPEMESFTLPAGLYAVFFYRGFNTNPAVFHYIFGDWLPKSNYWLDDRPHFELLGENYKNNDLSSEEEIWIPVRLK